MEIKADPTQEQATALTRQFRANLKRKGVTHLQAVPFVSAAVTPYQWRMRGVRILGYYDIGPFKDEGFYLRADAVERA